MWKMYVTALEIVRHVIIIICIVGGILTNTIIKMDLGYSMIETETGYVTGSQIIFLPEEWVDVEDYVIQTTGNLELACFDSNYGIIFIDNNARTINNGRLCVVFILTERLEAQYSNKESFFLIDRNGDMLTYEVKKLGQSFYLFQKDAYNFRIHEIVHRQ